MIIEWDQTKITPFQRKVFEATLRVPPGRVTTYKEIGQAIGCRSPRAVGQALRCNPFAPLVPCHRVIASDASIGGFGGTRQGPEIKRKLGLLKHEGVIFEDGRLKNPTRLYHFSA